MKLTTKNIAKSLLLVLGLLSLDIKAQCPTVASNTLIAQDTNSVFNGAGQGTTNAINSPYTCNSMAFVIWPTSTNTTSIGIAQPCIRTRYNLYYTNIRNNVTESRYENGGLIWTLAPGNPAANRIGGATPPISGLSLWDFSLYQLDPTRTHSVSIVKTGGGAITSDSISVKDCWRNTPVAMVYTANPTFTTGTGLTWSDPANSGHLGTTAWSISPAAVWPAVGAYNFGMMYVDPLYLAPATYTVTYTFTPPANGTVPCNPINLTYTFTVAPPSANSPNWNNLAAQCSASGCVSLSGQVTGTAGGTWSGTGVSGTNFCPITSGAGSFPVTYQVGPSSTCNNTQTHTITVNPTPTLTAGPPATYSMCTGGNVGLSVSGASTYTWAPAGSLNNANSATPTATPGSTTIYTVSGTSALGCVSSAVNETVTVNTPPTISITGAASPTICPGATVALSATGGSTYTWTPSATLSNANISNPTANPVTTTVYSVSGTSAAGCTSTSAATATVNVVTPSTISINPPSGYTVCPGGTVGMSVSGASTYTWTPSSSLNNANSATPSSTPTITTVYTVTGTDASGCAATSAVTTTVSINTPPTLAFTPNAAYTVCPGGTVGMSVSGASTYTWSPAASLDNANSATPNSTPTITTIYTVTGTDASGCSSSGVTTATVSINTPPTISVGSSNYTVCPGGTVGISANGASSYTWTPSATLDNPNIAGPNSTPAGTTVYTVTGTDASGCTATAAATTTVTVNPVITPTITPNPASLCAGGTTTLTASGANTYTWSANLGSVSTNPVTVTPAGTDTYSVNGTDLSGCATATGTVAVTVGGALSVTITPTANSFSLCSGQTTTLTASGATTYTWLPSGISATSITVNPTSNTTYTLIGSAGCTGSTTATVSVTTTPSVTPTSTLVAICSGATATLTANGSASTYTWSANAGSATTNTVSVSPGSTTIYTVTGETNGCKDSAQVTVNVTNTPTVTASAATSGTVCAGQSTTLNGSGNATTYTWMPGPINTPVATVSPATNTNYTLVGSNGSCPSLPFVVSVTVNPVPSLTVNPSASAVCSDNNTVTISATGGATYTWMPGAVVASSVTVNPTSNTTYTVIAATALGCLDSATQVISVTTTPTVAITTAGSATTICSSGSGITLNAVGTATLITWLPGGVNTTSINVNPASTTTYTLVGANGTCTAIATQPITVNSSPTVTAVPATDIAYCGSSVGAIHPVVTTGGVGPYSYQWYNGSVPVGTNLDSLAGVGAGTYSVLITDLTTGCTTTASGIIVTGTPKVIASITPSSTEGQAPVNVNFGNNTTGATTYSWDFGNGTFSSVFSPSTSFTTPGTYTVVMTASSSATCLDKDTAIVIVDAATSIVIPNIFSPNGDGINDNFMIASTGIKTLSCEIFNRWGTKMYTLSAPNQAWDGKTTGGENATEGTYFYMLTATGYDGKNYNYQGPLTLVK